MRDLFFFKDSNPNSASSAVPESGLIFLPAHPAEMKSTYFLLSHKELPIPEAQKPLQNIWTPRGESVVVGFFYISVYFFSY